MVAEMGSGNVEKWYFQVVFSSFFLSISKFYPPHPITCIILSAGYGGGVKPVYGGLNNTLKAKVSEFRKKSENI